MKYGIPDNIYAVLLAFAILTACEKVDSQEPTLQEGSRYLFTAQIVSDTKASLEPSKWLNKYKTRWSEMDAIILKDATDPRRPGELCYVTQGAGTSTGIFAASLESSSYYAIFASLTYLYEDGQDYIYVPSIQYHHNIRRDIYADSTESDNKVFLSRDYPMAAKSNTRKLKFYNLCSILKFSVTGNGEYLQSILVKSNDGELLSGAGVLDLSGRKPVMTLSGMSVSGGSTELLYKVEQELTSDPLDCYIILPSQDYDKGFTIELHTDTGWMDVVTKTKITLDQSEMFEIKEPVQYVAERDV